MLGALVISSQIYGSEFMSHDFIQTTKYSLQAAKISAEVVLLAPALLVSWVCNARLVVLGL